MTASRLLSLFAFALAFGSAVAVEWAARRPGSRVPTLAQMCGFVMRYQVGRLPVGRIALFGFWWWVGWHFLAR